MNARSRQFGLFVCLTLLTFAGAAEAQIFARPFQPAPAILDELDAAGRRQLDRARRYAAGEQPGEGVEMLRQLAERQARTLIAAEPADAQSPPGFQRFLPVARFVPEEFIRWKTSAPEAAKIYRELTDARAAELLQQGGLRNDEAALRRIVDQFAASGSADEANLRLGDLALERGEYARARSCYLAVAANTSSFAAATVRLPLVSLLEGNSERAGREIDRLPPTIAAGEVQRLRALEKEAQAWLPRKIPSGVTFANDETRQGRSDSPPFDLAPKPRWTMPLPRINSDRDVLVTGRTRIADDLKAIQAYYPLVSGDIVFVRADVEGQSSLVAHSLADGRELWRTEHALPTLENDGAVKPPELSSDAHRGLAKHLGVVRYTLTANNGQVFARAGSPITAPAERRLERLQPKDQGVLLAVDVTGEGKPLEGFPLYPEGTEWAFEGSPLIAGDRIYVALTRREGTRRQLHIACYERLTTPIGLGAGAADGRSRGRLLWRTSVAAGDTVGGGELDELSHTLLSRAEGLLFVCTNLGAVAALNEDGALRWLVRYPRAPFSAEPTSFSDLSSFRDLTPPLVHRGHVLFAPQDFDGLFAVDALSGRILWRSTEDVTADSIHVLGAAAGVAITSGRGLTWLDMETGERRARFPAVGGEESKTLEGLGRGFLTAHEVLFPTRQSLFVFPLLPRGNSGESPVPLRKISLSARGATGGNVVVAPGTVLIATGTELFAFDALPGAGQGGDKTPPR